MGQPSPLAKPTCRLVVKALPSLALCGVPADSVSSFGGFGDGQLATPALPGDPVSPAAGSAPQASAAIAVPTPAPATSGRFARVATLRSHPSGSIDMLGP